MGKNNSISMEQLLASINEGKEITRAAQQTNSEQLAEVAKANESYYDAFIKRMDSHEDNMSKGMFHLNESINQGAAATIKEVRESESRLAKKIDSKSGLKALGVIDWLTIILVTIISGVGGWFFSNCMINHQFAAWVDRTDTTQLIRDAAGNLTDVTVTTSAVTVWPTVIITIVLFAVVGFTVTLAICDAIRQKEGD